MNNSMGDLEVDNLPQAKKYFKKMREMYQSKLGEYVK